MSDQIETFKALRAYKQEKKKQNQATSTHLLKREGVLFESKQDGQHLIVSAGDKIVDFWPSTGLWIERGNEDKRKRGVRKLINFVKETAKK